MDTADLVLTGGVVWCGLGRPRAEAVAMRQDRIMAVGTTSDMRGLIGTATRVIDLRGASRCRVSTTRTCICCRSASP
ncbi:hypothetical protein ACFSYD_19660 [Paracoccus aerius]